MSALDDLIAAVEAGNMTRAQSSTVWKGYEWGFDARVSFVEGAFHGSLDAAKALHDALLPGWTLNSLHQERHPDNGMKPTGRWTCLLFAALPGRFCHEEVKSDNPARSWLLAILRAYRSLQEKPE